MLLSNVVFPDPLGPRIDTNSPLFTFNFTPKSKEESEVIRTIVKTFKFHAHPEFIEGSKGKRSIPVEDFCTGPGSNTLEDGEILVSLSIPNQGSKFNSAYERFIPRNEMDIAVAGVASSILIGSNGKIESARIALASVGPTPIFAKKASESLIGKEPGEAAFNEAGAIAKTECSPIEDMRGTVDQRKHLVDVLTVRTLNKSLERIGG